MQTSPNQFPKRIMALSSFTVLQFQECKRRIVLSKGMAYGFSGFLVSRSGVENLEDSEDSGSA